MQKLTISKMKMPLGIEKITKKLDSLKKAKIEMINWDEFPYLPDVQFVAAYNEDHFFLKYYISEEHAKAVTNYNNGPVWEDSCCEFFCAFDDSGYYNLETNCIGAQLLGWHGKDGSKEQAGDSIMAHLQKSSTLGNKVPFSANNIQWQLTLVVPVSVFFKHKGLKLTEGMKFKANFYKCGDKTNIPHFVSWNPIQWPEPNFHRPEFFGMVELG
jgi:hypothetical protein